ncbi:Serine active site containing protein 1 [Chamberlinius hualienensis]
MKIKWKGVLTFSGVTLAIGSYWLVRQVYFIKKALIQAMPMHVMTGDTKMPTHIYLSDDAMNGSDDPFTSNRVGSLVEGFIWKAIQPRTSWELVYLATAKEKHHRLLGLRLLSSLNNLNDGICREIAQASDFQLAVGLARCKNADLRLLLPPPPLPPDLKMTELQDDLCRILKALPTDNSNRCSVYSTMIALKQIQNSQELDGHEWWWHGGGIEETPKKFRKPTKENLALLFLYSILLHSTNPVHRAKLMDLKILPVLMKLYNDKTWTTKVKIQSLIAQVLGNLALDDQFQNAFFQSGWISVLGKWSRDSDLELSLSSEKVLGNLDQYNTPNKYEDGVYVVNSSNYKNNSKSVIDVVFIHGLLGGAFKTWRQKDLDIKFSDNSYTHCWPRDWLANDLPQIRVILIDYETHLTEWNSHCPHNSEERTIQGRSQRLLEKLQSAGVGRRPVIWISHSMGGLLMKQMLVLSQSSDSPLVQQFYKQTIGTIFFSVPHRGTKIAMPHFGSQYITIPSPEVKQLHYDAKHLLDLHENYLKIFLDNYPPSLSFCETRDTKLGKLNLSARFVTKESATGVFNEEFHSINTDHLYICKPSCRESFIYQRVVQFIKKQIQSVNKTDSTTDLGSIVWL